MNRLNKLLLIALLLFSVIIVGQTKVTGTVVDEMGEPLPGASIVENGTTNGTTTDFDGIFNLKTKATQGTLTVSFVGFTNKELAFNSSGDLGLIQLTSDNKLKEVVVTAYSIAIDRKTPVAVSTIKAAEIQRKLGSQEFPEILKSTPGVYATRSGGGFGDGRINMRGFTSENIGVLINGVPVNDMESGRVFWSNWAGLGDVTSMMQTQRGLGASKVAVPSVGGTINIVTKSTDAQKGGSVIAATGNNGYQKYGLTLSTGKMDNNLAATISVAKTSGEGFVDATPFKAFNYFANIAYEFNDKHTLSLTSFGTPQEHGQRFLMSSIEDYRNAPSGIRYNPDVAYLNGELELISKNYYHKNQTSLNHYWNINDDTSLSTAAYFSIGKGGVTFDQNEADFDLYPQGIFEASRSGANYYDPINLDNVVEINKASENGSQGFLRTVKNEHEWYGILSTLKTKVNDKLDFLAGLDYRHYTGFHYNEVADLLGGAYVFDDFNVNNPTNAAKVGDKILYNNDGIVDWYGAFVQLEYSNDKIDAFISSSTSNTSYQRVDYANYLDSDPLQKSDTYDFVGYGTKGGVNYKITEIHNVFANAGYFERAPFFNSVFASFNNEDVNSDAPTEKVFSLELGYGIRTPKFSANLNAYRTEWNDKADSQSYEDQSGERRFVNILGINALHQGVEFDFAWKPINALKFTGMASYGDWKWNNNIANARVFDDSQNLVGLVNAPLKGLRVSDVAQTTAALGLLYKFWKKTSITLDGNYFGNLYADADIVNSVNVITRDADESVEDFLAENLIEDLDSVETAEDTWKMPNYITFDGSIRHGFEFGSFDTTLTFRVNNILNTEYISDARGNNGGGMSDALVWFGAGRTFSLGAKIKF